MAASEDERGSADTHITAAVDTARHFPENVFRGDWHAYWFFDPDNLLNFPEAIYAVHALLEAEGAACAVLRQLSERNDPGKGLLHVCIDREDPPKPVHPLLFSPASPNSGATRFLEDFAAGSDRGGWCIYVEGQAELGVLAVREERLREALEPAKRLLGAHYIEKLARMHTDIRPSFVASLRSAYGWGTSPRNWGHSATTAESCPAVPTPVSAGSSLVARTAEHARVLYPLLKGTTVCDTLVWDGPASLESFLDTFVNQPGDPSHRHFTILGGGVPVGALSIRPGFQPPRGDLGYWVGIPHQGKGYATAAVGEALRIAFTDMGMEKIEACAFLGNRASRRVLEKCGFVQEGLTRKAILKRGRWLDEWVFGITREEWASR